MPRTVNLPKAIKDKMPRDILQALYELADHEDKIMVWLSDPANAKLFADSPGEALKRMGVPVNPLLIQKLKGLRGMDRYNASTLPNGQTITPKVRIRFVKGG